MQFTDTHAHYFDRKFDALPGGAQGVLNDPAFRASVRAVINIGTNLQNSREAVAQAARYPFMAAVVGIHPEDCQVYPGAPGWYEGQKPLEPEEELPRLRAWLADPAARRRDKIVAIGEIGLDRHWQPVDSPRQQAFFDGQLALAVELDLPVIVHDREAHGACLDAVCRHEGVRGVFLRIGGNGKRACQARIFHSVRRGADLPRRRPPARRCRLGAAGSPAAGNRLPLYAPRPVARHREPLRQHPPHRARARAPARHDAGGAG